MERDRALVTLSAAGVGLLVTILTAIGVGPLRWVLWLYAGAFAGFVVTLLSTITVFGRNSRLIEEAIQGTAKESLKLKHLDVLSITCFALAACCTIAIGIVAAVVAR
jgi:hypothetical protein